MALVQPLSARKAATSARLPGITTGAAAHHSTEEGRIDGAEVGHGGLKGRAGRVSERRTEDTCVGRKVDGADDEGWVDRQPLLREAGAEIQLYRRRGRDRPMPFEIVHFGSYVCLFILFAFFRKTSSSTEPASNSCHAMLTNYDDYDAHKKCPFFSTQPPRSRTPAHVSNTTLMRSDRTRAAGARTTAAGARSRPRRACASGTRRRAGAAARCSRS